MGLRRMKEEDLSLQAGIHDREAGEVAGKVRYKTKLNLLSQFPELFHFRPARIKYS